MTYCPGCGAPAQADASFCSKCGKSIAAEPGASSAPSDAPFGFRDSAPGISPPPQAATTSYASPSSSTGGLSPAPVTTTTQRPISSGTAIAALLLNILVWPGLGSLVAGENVGWGQGFLALGGVILAIVLIGIPMLIGAWIWGLVTGIQLIQRADAQAAAR